MSGIFQRSDTERQEYSLTATRRAHSVGFLFNVVSEGTHGCTHISPCVEPMACHLLTSEDLRTSLFLLFLPILRLALSVSWTC